MVRQRPLLVAALLGWVAVRALADPLPPPPTPDPAFYAKHIAPWIETSCAACHRGGSSGFALPERGPAGDVAAGRRADFAVVARYVDPMAPASSRLIRKVLRAADGGDEHVGGAFVELETDRHDALLDFASGATLTNLTPEPYFENETIRAKPGEVVVLDGSDAYDRDLEDTDKLQFFWRLVARPSDSTLSLSHPRSRRIEVRPDQDGSYVFALRVGDGKVWSAPRPVQVEVFDHAKVRAREAGALSGLGTIDTPNLRRIRRLFLDLLGRTPLPHEVLGLAQRDHDEVVRELLLRAEMGRAYVEDLAAHFGLIGTFRPEGQEARELPLTLASAGHGPAYVEAVLLRDPSFLRRYGEGRSLAQGLARLTLGRDATESEWAAAEALARGEALTVDGDRTIPTSRQWIAHWATRSDVAEAAVRRRLGRFLPSGETERRLGGALAAIEQGGKAWMAFQERVLTSGAWRGRTLLRPRGAPAHIRSLFIDLLGRRPTGRELAAWLRAARLVPGDAVPFSILARALIDSGDVPLPLLVDIRDGPRWLEDRFLRYLGRRPTDAERKLYGEALVHPEGGVELVVHALVSGPEYACR